jgi:sugar lactone lactonase YvrE
MAELRAVLSDLVLVESPRWHDDRLVFSDWGTGEIVVLESDGNRRTLGRVEGGMPFCLDRLPDGRLLTVTQQGLMTVAPDGTLSAYADLGGLSEFAWNDIVVDGRGHAYVNNINHDFGGEFAPGFVALASPDGPPRLVADELAFPNGMAVTPDGSTLIVAESYAGVLTAYAISDDGSLSDRRVWADLAGAAPDGICVDVEGSVWFAEVPGQRCVRVAEGGEVLQTISGDRGYFSCALGGPDRRTLYVTAASWSGMTTEDARTGQILAAIVDVPGAGWPG